MLTRLRLTLAILALPVLLSAAFPPPAGYVNDTAGLLDARAREELVALLRDVQQATTAEIAVATVTSLDGMSVEEYASKLFRAWGIGKKGADNGVLVLVAPTEHKMRIEVGYGLEGVLPDGLAGEIVRTEFLPRFKENDYTTGIRNGVRRVAAIVRTNHRLTPEERAALEQSARPPAVVMVPFLGLFVAFGFLMVGLGLRTRTIFPSLFGAAFGGIPTIIALVPFFNAWPLFQVCLGAAMAALGYRLGGRAGWARPFRPESARGAKSDGWIVGGTSSSSSSSDWSSGGDSDSSSSSSDSFGGGDSGGGGASGSW